MSAKEKKKKSLASKILKWTGISLGAFIIILLLVPIIFKNQLKDLVIKEVNKSLTAELSMSDFDLTFISTFPNMTIQLDDTKLVGTGKFKGIELAKIKQFRADVGFWNVVGGSQIEIDAIHLEEPSFDIRILKDGTANYDIVKPDSIKTPEELEEPSNFKLSLKKYSISKGTVNYDDQAYDMSLKIKNLNHSGKGDLTESIVDFETSTNMDQFSFDMDGISYLTEVKTAVLANFLMEFTDKSSKFTLKENKFNLNALNFSVDGFYEMFEDYDAMDLKLDASKATFKEFLSLLPTFYKTGYEDMVTTGNMEMAGFVKGRMDETSMPGWDFTLNAANASIRYPDLPGTITNIVMDANSKFEGGTDLDKMTVDVAKFHADFVGNSIDANLQMRNPMTDPLLVSKIKAKLDLATLKKVIPMAEGESYSGKMNADVAINGRMSSLDKGDYEAFKAAGTLELKNMLYTTKDLSDKITIEEMLFRFNPKNVRLEKLAAKTGNSDFQMVGTIDNYMGYIFRDELLKGNFTFTSKNLDIDQLMQLVPTETGTATTETVVETAVEPTLIPDNIDFNLTTNIANLRYNNMDIKAVAGNVRVKEEVASLDNLTMKTMGGTVALKGSYDTKDHTKPKMDLAYSLQEINVKDLAKNFLTIQKLAPISNYASGKISSNFSMKSDLTANLEPIYASLTGLGDLSSQSLTVSGFEPLVKMGEVLNMSKLASQTIKDLKTKFKFADGKVNVTPFDVQLGKIKTTVSGSTSFEQDIDYALKMLIPKEEIPAKMIKSAEQAIAGVNKISPKLDIKTLPDFLPVTVGVAGTVKNPKITTNFKEAILEATGNLKEQLVEKVKETIKDTVKAVVGEKIKEVKEDIEAKKQQILAEAQKNADKLKAEAKKAADAIRSEAAKQAADLTKQAGGNPLKQKAAEIAGNKLKKEAEEKATKIEKEADQKADALMDNAKQKAAALK